MKERAELGIDGNCGFALLGENIQEGEAEFVEIPPVEPLSGVRVDETFLNRRLAAELGAAKKAFEKLRARLNKPSLRYYFGPSHPYGR